jgi:hypothetical protein
MHLVLDGARALGYFFHAECGQPLRASRSCRNCLTRRVTTIARKLITYSPANGGQIDAIQNERQLPGRDLDPLPLVSGGCVRELVRSPFQLLVPDTEACSSPVQQLDAIAAAIDEDKQVTDRKADLAGALTRSRPPGRESSFSCRLALWPTIPARGSKQKASASLPIQ